MTPPNLEPGHIFILGTMELQPDETLHSVLEELKKLEVPDFLRSQFVGLGTDDPEQMHVAFSDGEDSSVHFTGGSGEDELEASFVLTSDHRGSLPTLLTRTLETTGTLELQQAHASFSIAESFSSLDLPLEDPKDYTVIGVRLESGEGNFIVQKDGEKTSIQHLISNPGVLEGPIGEEFLDRFDESVEELIERVI